MTWLWLGMTGLVMGLFSGLLGIGGGVVAVPMLMFCVGMTTKQAMGTSLAIIVPVAIVGSIKHYTQRNVDLQAALCIAVTGIIAAWVGAWLNGILPALWLKRIFGVFLLALGVKIVFFTPTEPKKAADAVAEVEVKTAPAESPR